MRNIAFSVLIIFLLSQIKPFCAYAQEENSIVIKEGTRYVNLKISALDKYNSRMEKQQARLINKLKRKEKHFANRLKANDSLAYEKYKGQATPSFDSISKLSKSDTGVTAAGFSKRKNRLTDSLKGIASFVKSTINDTSISPKTVDQNVAISKVQGQLNFRTYITQLISQRTNSLNSLSSSGSNIPGLTGIDKQVYYTKAKMNVFKEMEEDPTVAENKALEYLQGSEGFDKTMNNATQGCFTNAVSSTDMQITNPSKIGFISNTQMQQSLQNKFGSSLPLLANRVSTELNNWQDKAQQLQQGLSDVKSVGSNLRNINEPIFKVNPMRGLPFWKRLQKQYSCQLIRSNISTGAPTLVQPSIVIGFKHTPSLTYGIGAESSFGLGQNWQNIHFSFQGIGFKTYANWLWQYGFGAYAGYERIYKQFVFTPIGQPSLDIPQTQHNTLNYQENILIGLTKNYSVSKKYDGQIQALYNVWWQQDGLNSPIVIRVSFLNK